MSALTSDIYTLERTGEGDISCCPSERDTDVECGNIPSPSHFLLDRYSRDAWDSPDQLSHASASIFRQRRKLTFRAMASIRSQGIGVGILVASKKTQSAPSNSPKLLPPTKICDQALVFKTRRAKAGPTPLSRYRWRYRATE